MISIIGAGPAGCYTAYNLAKKGEEVSIFEEHKKIGEPVQCTGIITSSINNIIKVKKNSITNKIKKARIICNDSSIEINLKNPNIILDRKEFDLSIAEKAEKQGARIFLDERYKTNKGNNIITSKRKIKSSHIIGADGPASKVAKENSLLKNRKYLFGFQARVKLKNDNAVEFFPNIGTFAWIVPENKEIARIGILDYSNAKHTFEEFLRQHSKKKDVIDYQTGIVPLYNPNQKTQKDTIYLVGDAASQVKATTGGGIIQSLTAAEALSDSIINNKDYEKEWKSRIGRDLWMHLKMRTIMDKFKEKDWEKIIDIFSKEKNKKILENFDRDYPSKFLLRLLIREPRLMYFGKCLLQ